MVKVAEHFSLGVLVENASAAASSASCYHITENIGILSVVVPKGKLRQYSFMAERICGTYTSRAIVAAADLAMNLKRAYSLFALSHQVNDLEPSAKRVVGILENGLRDNREAVTVFSAAVLSLAKPMERSGFQFIYLLVVATLGTNPVRPAESLQVRLASLVRGKLLLQLMK